MLDEILQIDRWLFILFNVKLANPLFDMVMPFLRTQEIWYPLYLVLLILLYRQYKVKSIYVILTLALLIVCSDQFSANLVKNLFKRVRPCNAEDLAGITRHLIESCRGYSFISAHATNHFAIAAFFSVFFKSMHKSIPFAFYIWAAFIAYAQVYVGVHYPFDVITGALVGTLFGSTFAKYLNKYLVNNG